MTLTGTMSPDSVGTTTQSEWHSIRPWSPRLSLFVREITSVSATFIISSTLSNKAEADLSLALLGLTGESESEEDEEDIPDSTDPRCRSIISNVLAKGLSVHVNSAPWKMVYIRMDEKADEAVIIIYGLMPGRQYDIILSLVQGGQNNSIRRKVITEESDLPSADVQANVEDASFSYSISSDATLPTASTSTNGTIPATSPTTDVPPTHGFTSFTLEDRLSQLQHTLNLLNSERDSLTASLKAARRDAQKADAALRSEIEILKRTSEKHTVVEHRSRQKILALQEAVKRAQTATREIEELVKEVESGLPALNETMAEKEREYAKVKEDADRVRQEREKEEEKERKKAELTKGELQGLGNKMEKLNVKKEKLEDGVADLEEQLKEIEKEIEGVTSDRFGYGSDPQEAWTSEIDQSGGGTGTSVGPGGEIISDRQPHSSYLPVQRTRHQSAHALGAIARPSPAPIQRPSHTRPNSTSVTSVNQQRTQTLANHWSTSLHPRSPGLHANLQRRSSLRSSTSQPPPQILQNPQAHAQSNTTPAPASTSSPSSAPAITSSTVPTSILSSRAPPFEPGRSLRSSGSPALVHRPGPSRGANT